MTQERDGEREAESQRILKRLREEDEGSGSALVGRVAKRARNHLGAADVDDSDWAEHWGTRIGRVLGLLLLIGLVVWLVLFVVKGG